MNVLRKTPRLLLWLSVSILCLAAGVACVFFFSSPRRQPTPAPPARQKVETSRKVEAWRKVETEQFSFSIPASMKEYPVRAYDSSVWRYADEKITLEVQYGLYPDDLEFFSTQPDFRKETVTIDGLKAKQITFRMDESLASHYTGVGKYVAAIYFPDLANDGSEDEMNAQANCESTAEQQVVKEIFASIKFKRTQK
jgi:hypothetical protein